MQTFIIFTTPQNPEPQLAEMELPSPSTMAEIGDELEGRSPLQADEGAVILAVIPTYLIASLPDLLLGLGYTQLSPQFDHLPTFEL